MSSILIRLHEIACGCLIASEWQTDKLVVVRCRKHVIHEGQPARLYRALALMEASRANDGPSGRDGQARGGTE